MCDSKGERATQAAEGAVMLPRDRDELLARQNELTDLILNGMATLADYGALARVQQKLDRLVAAEVAPSESAQEPSDG